MMSQTLIHPQHVAFIMDGNRRWAKQHNLPVFEGHRQGFKTVKRILLFGKRLGIKYATLYAFSTENWQRTVAEVKFLMQLLEWLAINELNNFIKEKVRIKVIGDLSKLSPKIQNIITHLERTTQSCTDTILQIAFSYGAREEITQAVKHIVTDQLLPETITEHTITHYLYTNEIPDPDLLIRTGGQLRLSNFLLWQLSYTELYFTDVLWPDFDENEFNKALEEFSKRKRNFGK